MLQGELFVVAIPIGNVRDITVRAQELLSQADVIACEDTRVAGVLLSQLGIEAPQLLAHHEQNESASAQGLIDFLRQGRRVVLISDAGTPLVSDPGHHLIREAFANGITPKCIPGPSSLAAAMSVCPIGGNSHYFGGFAPSQPGARKRMFQRTLGCADRLIFFEAPHRIREHLEDAFEVFGNTPCFIARELTKTHEELLFKNLDEMRLHFQQTQPRGEFVIVYQSPEPEPLSEKHVERHITRMLQEGSRDQDIIEELRETSGLRRKALYEIIQRLKGRREPSSEE